MNSGIVAAPRSSCLCSRRRTLNRPADRRNTTASGLSFPPCFAAAHPAAGTLEALIYSPTMEAKDCLKLEKGKDCGCPVTGKEWWLQNQCSKNIRASVSEQIGAIQNAPQSKFVPANKGIYLGCS